MLTLLAKPSAGKRGKEITIGSFSLFPSDQPARFLIDSRPLKAVGCAGTGSHPFRFRLQIEAIDTVLTGPLTVRAVIVPSSAYETLSPQDTEQRKQKGEEWHAREQLGSWPYRR